MLYTGAGSPADEVRAILRKRSAWMLKWANRFSIASIFCPKSGGVRKLRLPISRYELASMDDIARDGVFEKAPRQNRYGSNFSIPYLTNVYDREWKPFGHMV
jgi:hypothetical protein